MTDNLTEWLQASGELESTAARVDVLEHSEEVEDFNGQLELLKRRLVSDPSAFRQMFIDDGMSAVMWEFRQEELSPDFARQMWAILLREDDASRVLMRYVWALPLKGKRKFVRALDAYLSDRYPMFAGLSKDWPAGNQIPPHIRDPNLARTTSGS